MAFNKNLLVCPVCGEKDVIEYSDDYLKCPYCGAKFLKPKDEEMEQIIAYKQIEKYLQMTPPKFDTAEELARDLIREYPKWATPYWGYIRAKYGIKYEYDDLNNNVVPICYDGEYKDFSHDPYFLKAVELERNIDIKNKYISEANRIKESFDKYQEAVKNEDYDVFISFKARENLSDNETKDKKKMEELYNFLTSKGLKVFFSPISMNRHLFKPYYDVYIYNAINKAKVMILFGSDVSYFESTWIRNEWSRYLSLISEGKKKNESFMIVTDNINEDDFPRAFKRRQSLDINKNKDTWMDLIYLQISNILRVNEKVEVEKKILEEPPAPEEKPHKKENKEEKVNKDIKEGKEIKLPFGGKIKLPNFDIIKAGVVEGFKEAKEGMVKGFKSGTNQAYTPISDFEISKGGIDSYKGNNPIVIIPKKINRINEDAFYSNNVIEEVTIHNDVDFIGDSAFYNCNKLKKIVIGRGVKKILDSTFYNCSSLEDIKFGSEIVSISDSAFYNCSNIKKINFSKELRIVGDSAFYNCSSLQEVTFDDSLKSIGDSAFYNCSKLEKISYRGTCKEWKKVKNHRSLSNMLIPANFVYCKDGKVDINSDMIIIHKIY